MACLRAALVLTLTAMAFAALPPMGQATPPTGVAKAILLDTKALFHAAEEVAKGKREVFEGKREIEQGNLEKKQESEVPPIAVPSPPSPPNRHQPPPTATETLATAGTCREHIMPRNSREHTMNLDTGGEGRR